MDLGPWTLPWPTWCGRGAQVASELVAFLPAAATDELIRSLRRASFAINKQPGQCLGGHETSAARACKLI